MPVRKSTARRMQARRMQARRIEVWLADSRWLRYLVGAPVVEVISRTAAWLTTGITQRSRFGIERRVRGLLSSPQFGATGLTLDRRLQMESPQHLRLGNGVTLYGGSHFVSAASAGISIGDRTHIGRNCVLSGLGGIRIGAGCAIASSVCIYSISNHFGDDPRRPILDHVEHAEVTIGDDVWIGAGATILPGVRIGDHAVVAAGAVVRRDIEPWKVVAGVPARVVKDRRDSQSTRTREVA